MPTTVIAEETRRRLTQSMSMVQRQQDHLIRQMQEYLRFLEARGALGNPDETSELLFTMLFDCAKELAATGRLRNLAVTAAEHHRQGLDARHYARFGLGLGQMLREAPAPVLPHATVAAWCAAYWAVIRALPHESSAPIPRAVARRSVG